MILDAYGRAVSSQELAPLPKGEINSYSPTANPWEVLNTVYGSATPPNGSGAFHGEFNLLNLPRRSRSRWNLNATSLRDALTHWLVFRCINKIVEAAQDTEPGTQEKKADKWEFVPSHPLTTLLAEPNERQTWADFLSSMIVSEHVFGRMYFRKIYQKRTRALVGLEPLDVRFVTEVGEHGVRGWHDGWDAWGGGYHVGRIVEYEVMESLTSYTLPADEVLAIHCYDHTNPLCAISATMTALGAVGVEANLDDYLDGYLVNGSPAGLLAVKNKRLSDTQMLHLRERWKAQYRDKGYLSGGIAVMDEDVTFQQMGSHLDELAATELRNQDHAAITGAFGVPAILAGAYIGLRYSNQKAGQAGAQKDFWQNKISPMMSRYRKWFNRRLLPEFELKPNIGRIVRFFYILDEVAALAEDVNAKAQRGRDNYDAGLATRNEARIEAGLEPVPGGDVFIDGTGILDLKINEAKALAGKTLANLNPKPSIALLSGAKSFDFQGRVLSRKPTEAEEKMLGFVASAQDIAREALTPVMLRLRTEMIGDAQRRFDASTDNTVASGSLSARAATQGEIEAAIRAAYQAGAASLLAESRKGKYKAEDEAGAIVRILTAILAALATQVAARFASYALRRILRGLDREQASAEARAEMDNESTVYAEDIATGGAYQAVGDGREAAIRDTLEPGDRIIYSSVLDVNTCGDCASKDLTESTDPAQVPTAPNPYCDGRYKCRCMWVIIHATEQR